MKQSVLAVVVVCMLSSLVIAHETTYMGTIETVASDRVAVRTVDDKGKVASTPTAFLVTSSTKVMRGDKTVSWSGAAAKPGERIVVIVAHGDEAADGRPAKASQVKLAAS